MGILEILIILLVIGWIVGYPVLHIGGGLIHILLVVAVIVLVIRLIQGRRVV